MPAPAAPVAPANGTPQSTLASMYDIQDGPAVVNVKVPDAPPAPAAAATAPAPSAATAQPAPAPAPSASPAPSTTPAQPAVLPGGDLPSVTSSGSTPPQAPLTPASQHPAWLTRQAADLGVHPLVAERLDTASLTQVVMEELSRQRAEFAERSRAATIQQPPAAPQQAPAPGQPAAVAQPQQPPPFDWGTFDETDHEGRVIGKKTYTEADIDPAVAHHIRTLTQEVAGLKQFINTMGQQAQTSREAQVQAEFDRAFDRFPSIFGQGTAQTLKGKPEFERRRVIYGAVKGMYSAMPPAARDAMTIEAAVAAMTQNMFGAAAAATPTPAPAVPGVPTPQQFQQGAVAQPTQRRDSGKPLGRDRAVDEARQWWQDQQAAGGLPADGGTSIDEFL